MCCVVQLQQLMDLVITCKRNAENEVKRQEGGDGGLKAPGRKRRLEQETAETTIKYLKASQEPGRQERIPGEETDVRQESHNSRHRKDEFTVSNNF